MAAQEFALFDLDGCLANDLNRQSLLPLPGSPSDAYDEYHEASYSDRVCRPGERLLEKALQEGLVPVFITGRPAKFRELTLDWIKKSFSIVSPVLLMRPQNFEMGSPHLKLLLLGSRGFRPERIGMAVDDRDDVLEAYQRYGIIESGLFKSTLELSRPFCEASRPPEAHQEQQSPAAYLVEGAEVFKRSGGAYRDAYLVYGDVMAALFPEGFAAQTVEDWQRLGVFNQIMTKVVRYAMTLERGGHADSALDISVYGAMLRSITVEEK